MMMGDNIETSATANSSAASDRIADQHACCTKTSAGEKAEFTPKPNSIAPLPTAPHIDGTHQHHITFGGVNCQVPERNNEHRTHIDVSRLPNEFAEAPIGSATAQRTNLPTAAETIVHPPFIGEPANQQSEDAVRIPIRSVPYRPIVPILCTSCAHSQSDPTCVNCTIGQKAMYTLSLDKQFLKALHWVRHAPPLMEQKLRVHCARVEREALYYQITEGDITTPQPWAIQVEEREKWDAWNKLKGMSKEQATVLYLLKISEVDPHWMESTEIMCYTPIEENPLDSTLL